MSINLDKGGSINLSKAAPKITQFKIGLGWDAPDTGNPFDLDASAFMLNDREKFHAEGDFVFYNNLHSPEPTPLITHSGDNRDGSGSGDDETITVNVGSMQAVRPEVNQVSIIVTIHDAAARGQHFGLVKNAYARIYDPASGKEFARFNLTDECAGAYAVQMGSLMKSPNGDWKFEAVGAGSQAGLADFIAQYQE